MIMVTSHRRPSIALLVFVSIAASASAAAQELPRALAIEGEVRRIAREIPLWPGFEPLDIPLAVFTGDSTFLFRHPAPPDGFAAAAAAGQQVTAYRGRHAAVTANSSAAIGGVVTATLLADARRASLDPRAMAAVALHEGFHVFQRARHPQWSANEGDLLLYPAGDASLLTLRRLESAALRRAAAAAGTSQSACWARTALAARAERFGVMDSAFVAYERLNELNEGLAAYVQMRASGRAADTIPEAGFGATAIRHRAYATGPVLGTLLDRLRPGWRQDLERSDSLPLDSLLALALGSPPPQEAACAFDEEDRARIARAATADAEQVAAARTERRHVFDALAGWRLIVIPAEGRPLWPQGFDPLNTELVDGGVLHTRFLELGNDDGRVRMIDEANADLTGFTVGAGAHPLFNGVGEVHIIAPDRPELTGGSDGAPLRLRTAGLDASFPRASAEERARTIIVRLAPAP